LPNDIGGSHNNSPADVARGRLYVSAEKGAAILKSGPLIHLGGEVTAPHKGVVDKAANHLFVADADAGGSVKVLDPDLNIVARIPVGAKPNTGFVDAETYFLCRQPQRPSRGQRPDGQCDLDRRFQDSPHLHPGAH
jgi:DNA-binding beta-propeller fold protein YncE